MTQENNTQAAIDAGTQLAGANDRITYFGSENLADGLTAPAIPLCVVPIGMNMAVLTEVLNEREKRADAPKRRKGIAVHQELPSFIAHINRFKDEDSVVYADVAKTKLTAIYDYHHAAVAGDKGARWGQHRAIYDCPISRQWKLWMANDGVAMSQDAFGQLIDDNMADLANPNAGGALETEVAMPTALLQMARNLVVRTKGEFSRAVNVTTGEGTLVIKTENEESSTKIPRAFALGIPVFEGGTIYYVEARIRFAMVNQRPTFAYSLYQTEKTIGDAFSEVRKVVADATALPIFAGSPE